MLLIVSSPGMLPGGCDDGERTKCNRHRYYNFSLPYIAHIVLITIIMFIFPTKQYMILMFSI